MNANLKYLRRSLFLISTPMVFIMFGLPLRAEDLGASGFQIGILFTLFTVSVLILRPLVGIGLDHFGRRRFFIGALLFYLLANSLYAFGDTILGLYIARAIHGVGFSTLTITADTITSDLSDPKTRASAMGGNIASQSRGGMLGATIGFTLVGFLPIYAWRFSFAIYAAIAILAIVFALRTIPETLQRDHQTRGKAPFNFPPRYYRVLLAIFLAAFAAAVIQPYYLIYLRGRLGLEVYALAGVFLPVGIAYAILPGWLGNITNRLNRAAVISVGLVIATALYAAVPSINSFFWLIGAFVGAAIGNVLFDLTKNAWIADIAGSDAAGRTFGLAALATGMGAALGPLAGGVVYDQWGKEYIFYVAAGIFAAAVISILPFLGKAAGRAQHK